MTFPYAFVGVASGLSSLRASLSPTSAGANGAGSLTTGAVVTTATGGVAPYTYAWSWQIGGASITITSPTAASTTFSGDPPPGGELSGEAFCTVTDAAGAMAATEICAVSLTQP